MRKLSYATNVDLLTVLTHIRDKTTSVVILLVDKEEFS
jgi:hypothetical protein